ncbi:hypothetical protein KBY76_06120 [Synechococcus sp. GreenBA-s]|jgi:hypothetical protein|nr:hypothetical protein [Synechococcus sp. GreenBA-s]
MPSQPPTVAELLAALEELSRSRADRVLRLRGRLPVPDATSGGPGGADGFEPFELLIFRGFSSSVSHPTAFDPDQPALPESAVIETAELLQAPLNPAAEQRLAGPGPVQEFLSPERWQPA